MAPARGAFVSVDHFWKRVPAEQLTGCDPEELTELVPYWFDDEFREQRDAGLVVGAEDTGALVAALLRLGGADDGGLWPVTSGPADWDDHWMVGTIDADEVGVIAAALAGAPLRQWAASRRDDLAAAARSLGYRPFDDEWAAQVVQDTEDLTALFVAAAADGEAVVTKIVA
jgi:hypothetical protein